MATKNEPAVNARDRFGNGPWYNAEGNPIAANLEQLPSGENKINKENAVTERLDPVNGAGDNPNMHDNLTGSRGVSGKLRISRAATGPRAMRPVLRLAITTAPARGKARTRGIRLIHRAGDARDLQSTGGAGLFYCFAVD